MKITAMSRLETLGDGVEYEIKFSDETGDFSKRIHLSGLLFKIHGEAPFADRMQALKKTLREAERDVAFKMFGSEWRDHVGPFFGPPRKLDLALAEQAEALCPEYFA